MDKYKHTELRMFFPYIGNDVKQYIYYMVFLF